MGPELLLGPLGDTGSPRPLLSCVSGGVFVGSALLELLPSALCGLGNALQGMGLSPQFPLSAFILALGFLLLPLLEPIALEPEATPLHRSPAPCNPSLYEAPPLHLSSAPFSPTRAEAPPLPRSPAPLSPAHAAALLLALGLREAGAGPGLGAARLVHSGAVAAALALRMLRAGLRPPAVAAALLVLPAGAALGGGVALGGVAELGGVASGARLALARAVLRALAAGAFLYVTAREVPPPELREPRLRMRGALLLLAGFALVCGALLGRDL
ncbi:zinc transporter ZIP1 [Melopsittacus undulatus]|uniref:zinc transporter ZIP1 n=1 Tax=Melopsittacus undulatus TaxID=13146 RepID=UPI00146BDC87|nr:zinc transporter ZIP1 [Melopsittacus undulatus]